MILTRSTGPHAFWSGWALALCQRPAWGRARSVPARWTMRRNVIGFTLNLKNCAFGPFQHANTGCRQALISGLAQHRRAIGASLSRGVYSEMAHCRMLKHAHSQGTCSWIMSAYPTSLGDLAAPYPWAVLRRACRRRSPWHCASASWRAPMRSSPSAGGGAAAARLAQVCSGTLSDLMANRGHADTCTSCICIHTQPGSASCSLGRSLYRCALPYVRAYPTSGRTYKRWQGCKQHGRRAQVRVRAAARSAWRRCWRCARLCCRRRTMYRPGCRTCCSRSCAPAPTPRRCGLGAC